MSKPPENFPPLPIQEEIQYAFASLSSNPRLISATTAKI